MLKSLGPALAVAMTLALPVSSHAEEAGPRSWSRLFEACTGTCQELLQSLTPEDATALRELPERVARTLEEFDGEDYELLPAPVQGALARVQNLGRHQCRIDEKDGELSLTKLTGEGLSVRLVELEGGNVAVGRTYLPEQKERHYDRDRPNNRGNENFGNFVGLAFPDEGGRLVIVSADMHGHTEPDDTFFEVLVVE